jgi:hypothetical protein
MRHFIIHIRNLFIHIEQTYSAFLWIKFVSIAVINDGILYRLPAQVGLTWSRFIETISQHLRAIKILNMSENYFTYLQYLIDKGPQ